MGKARGEGPGPWLGLVLGFAVGGAVVWLAKSRARAPKPAPAPVVRSPALPALPPRPGPRYPASLDMFVSANKRSGASFSDDGESLPRVKEGAVAHVERVRSPAADAAEAPLEPEPQPRAAAGADEAPPSAESVEDMGGPLRIAMRTSGLGAAALLLAAWLFGGTAGSAARWKLGVAFSATAAGAVGVAARASGEGSEALVWIAASVFVAFLAFTLSDPAPS